jgi:hypothetical protein
MTTDTQKPTGRDDGLCQDYSQGLSRWFASRLDALYVARKVAAKLAKRVR